MSVQKYQYALSAVVRLQDMGVEPYLVASSLNMVQAQRLVRRLCPDCKQAREVSAQDWAVLETPVDETITHIYEAKGCDLCMNTGFLGRIAIYEMVTISDAMRNAIHEGKGLPTLRRLANQEKLVSLRQDGARHVAAGTTTLEEVLRVSTEGVIEA